MQFADFVNEFSSNFDHAGNALPQLRDRPRIRHRPVESVNQGKEDQNLTDFCKESRYPIRDIDKTWIVLLSSDEALELFLLIFYDSIKMPNGDFAFFDLLADFFRPAEAR